MFRKLEPSDLLAYSNAPSGQSHAITHCPRHRPKEDLIYLFARQERLLSSLMAFQLGSLFRSWNTSTRSSQKSGPAHDSDCLRACYTGLCLLVHLMMEFIAILFCSLAVVRHSSAQQTSPATTFAYTTSSTIFLPSALFNLFPAPQTFTGQVATTDSTTYYSLTYELGLSFFNPSNAPHTVGDYDNLYVFSASAAGTKYVLPQ